MTWCVLDLFSGIGGFSLGLERAGMTTVAFCEIEPYARAVLRKHWPAVPIYDDVRSLDAARLRADGIDVDVICGGFPCQDISAAGKGAGIEGERSGLWREYARLVGETRPDWVIVENVPALRTRGADRVLCDLESLGYAASPFVVGADDVGAPHRRKRVWIVAYPYRAEWRADIAPRRRMERALGLPHWQEGASGPWGGCEDVADADVQGQPQPCGTERALGRRPCDSGSALADGHGERLEIGIEGETRQFAPTLGRSWWLSEPHVGRVAHGVPARVDRLRALGNAVVPQIPEAIGRAIMRAEA